MPVRPLRAGRPAARAARGSMLRLRKPGQGKSAHRRPSGLNRPAIGCDHRRRRHAGRCRRRGVGPIGQHHDGGIGDRHHGADPDHRHAAAGAGPRAWHRAGRIIPGKRTGVGGRRGQRALLRDSDDRGHVRLSAAGQRDDDHADLGDLSVRGIRHRARFELICPRFVPAGPAPDRPVAIRTYGHDPLEAGPRPTEGGPVRRRAAHKFPHRYEDYQCNTDLS